MNARISQDQFDRIYLEDVIPALEHDRELSFLPKDANAKYFNKGICPGCGERTLYISKEKPFQLKCNRLNECQFEEKTRDRYRDLFENLSERFPSTPQNPNATADAYLQRSRGFDTARIAGWYKQARRQMNDGSYAATVRFELCDGYWESISSIRREIKNGAYRTIPKTDGTKGVLIDMEDLAQQATQQAEEALRQARGTSLLRKEQK